MKEVPDNVAVINATDLSPIMEHTQVKEIRELVAPDNKISTRPVEISLKVAELPTTTPIEVKTGDGENSSTVKSLLNLYP
jgi:protein O-GlcNAc transferase